MDATGRRERPQDRPSRRPRSGGSQITSLKNPVVQLARRLDKPAERAGHGRFLIEGARCVEAAVEAALPMETLLVTPAAALRHAALVERVRAGVPGGPPPEILTVTDQVMAAVASTVTPQGLLAVALTVARPIDE